METSYLDWGILCFLCSMTAVGMVWTRFAITSPSHTIIHVHSGSCSKPCYSRLFSCSPFFTPYVVHLPAYLNIMPFPSHCLFLLFSLLCLSTLISRQPFLLPPLSNHCGCLILQGLYSTPITSRQNWFPSWVISWPFAQSPTTSLTAFFCLRCQILCILLSSKCWYASKHSPWSFR